MLTTTRRTRTCQHGTGGTNVCNSCLRLGAAAAAIQRDAAELAQRVLDFATLEVRPEWVREVEDHADRMSTVAGSFQAIADWAAKSGSGQAGWKR